MSRKINYKIQKIIEDSLPPDEPPILTQEQLEKLKNITDIVLGIIGTVSIISLSLLAPNTLVAVDKLFLKRSPRRRFKREEKAVKIARAFSYMKEKNLIRMRISKNDIHIFLTNLGKKRLKKIDFESLSIKKPTKWDGKWWAIAADIPTKDYKWAADLFRRKLKEMKFYHLQRTLWFYPHDPRKEIEFIAKYYGIGHYLTAMEVSRFDLDDERKMKRFFKEEKVV